MSLRMTQWESICTLFQLDPKSFVHPIYVSNITESLCDQYTKKFFLVRFFKSEHCTCDEKIILLISRVKHHF